MERIRVRKRGKLSVEWPRDGGRYGVSKFRRAESMKIVIEDRDARLW